MSDEAVADDRLYDAENAYTALLGKHFDDHYAGGVWAESLPSSARQAMQDALCAQAQAFEDALASGVVYAVNLEGQHRESLSEFAEALSMRIEGP